MASVSEYLCGRDVFITGATGFIGKILLEKLLRSCATLNRIFILVRPKRGQSGENRLADLLANTVFDKVRSENPAALGKVVLVAGDVSCLRLGLSAEDVAQMRNVSIIYHVAASVRFDDPLKKAILMNVRGTRELLELAAGMEQLQSFVHVSTTYCNPKRIVTDEKIYRSTSDWRTLIRAAELMDESLLDALCHKLTDNSPNTYTFTKGLTEAMCGEYMGRMPLSIFRPSVVFNCYREPIPGWIDTFNGLCGLTIASGIGISRTVYLPTDIKFTMTPVDVCANGIIVSSFVQERVPKGNAPIYNCSLFNDKTFAEIMEIGKEFYGNMPFEKMLWYPGGVITKCYMNHVLRLFFYQLIPAVLVDCILRLSKRKPFLMKVQRISLCGIQAVYYFITKEWCFPSANYDSLSDYLSEEDRKSFYLQIDNFNYEELCRHTVMGGRRFLLKQSDDTVPASRIKYKRLYYLDLFFKCLKYGLFFYIVAYKIVPYILNNLFGI